MLLDYTWLTKASFIATSAWISLALVPVAWVGVKSGLWLQHRVSERLFYRLVILAMAIVGVQLVARSMG